MGGEHQAGGIVGQIEIGRQGCQQQVGDGTGEFRQVEEGPQLPHLEVEPGLFEGDSQILPVLAAARVAGVGRGRHGQDPGMPTAGEVGEHVGDERRRVPVGQGGLDLEA